MLFRSLAGVIFHELAHQRLYIADDSKFNEAFATAVEQIGTRRWLDRHGDETDREAYAEQVAHREAFLALVTHYRGELQALYTSDLESAEKHQRKAQTFAAMRGDYAAMARGWPAPKAYEAFFGEGLNNARLIAVATYFDWVPAFERLFDQSGGDIERFYARSEALGRLSRAQRASKMTELMGGASVPKSGNDH